jgi:hypothetical protein
MLVGGVVSVLRRFAVEEGLHRAVQLEDDLTWFLARPYGSSRSGSGTFT